MDILWWRYFFGIFQFFLYFLFLVLSQAASKQASKSARGQEPSMKQFSKSDMRVWGFRVEDWSPGSLDVSVVFGIHQPKALYMIYFLYIHIYAYMRTYIHACMHACIHTYIHTYMHTYMHTCTHTHIHTYTHTHTHTETHTHTHAENGSPNILLLFNALWQHPLQCPPTGINTWTRLWRSRCLVRACIKTSSTILHTSCLSVFCAGLSAPRPACLSRRASSLQNDILPAKTARICILSQPLIETLWFQIGAQTPPLSFQPCRGHGSVKSWVADLALLWAKVKNRNWQMRVQVPEMRWWGVFNNMLKRSSSMGQGGACLRYMKNRNHHMRSVFKIYDDEREAP